MARDYLDSDLKLLWGFAAARCCFPDCRSLLVAQATLSDPAVVVGEISHIESSSPSPKAPQRISSSPLDAKDRDRYVNLLLLCPTHHTLVDKQPNTYTVDDLRRWKRDHEAWVRSSLESEMGNVGFAELQILTSGIVNNQSAEPGDLAAIDLTEKMSRNGLTDQVRFLLTMGLSKAPEVRHFVAHVAVIDRFFPERLKSGFVSEYLRLRALGIEGDALFHEMNSFAASGRKEFLYQAAGLAVLTYLFEACEVFER